MLVDNLLSSGYVVCSRYFFVPKIGCAQLIFRKMGTLFSQNQMGRIFRWILLKSYQR